MKINNADFFLDNPARLQWACRRGMLELDVLLGNFLKEGYALLPQEDKASFVELLNCSDPELFSWFLGRERPVDNHLAEMVETIRHHARTYV